VVVLSAAAAVVVELSASPPPQAARIRERTARTVRSLRPLFVFMCFLPPLGHGGATRSRAVWATLDPNFVSGTLVGSLGAISAYREWVVRASNVVEDARDSPTPKSNRRGVAWLGAGLLIGAGLAVLFLDVDTAPETSTTTSTLGPQDTRVVAITGIGEEIPGFPDGLMATKRGEGLGLELVVWPESGDPSVRSVPFGTSSPPDPVTFDLSGRLAATLIPAPPDNVTSILYAGVPEAAAIISLDVSGYAWHDSVPEVLAYSTFEDGETRLWITHGNLALSEPFAQVVGIDGGVAAVGEWGFAVQDGDDVAIFDFFGEMTQLGVGRILGSEPSGWLAVDNDAGLTLMNVDGSSRVVAPNESPLDATFSPDGTLLATLTGEGLKVSSLVEARDVAVTSERPGMPQVVWSSDSRYALYPGLRGVVVLNTSDGSVRELMPTDIVTGLGLFDFDGQ
jgi:hypothetical protein